MEHVIAISATGGVKSMHNDRFPLSFLGEQSIYRASDIKWNESRQNWEIWFNVAGSFLKPFAEYKGFSSYEKARDFEVEVMNQCLKEDALPSDYAILEWARKKRPS